MHILYVFPLSAVLKRFDSESTRLQEVNETCHRFWVTQRCCVLMVSGEKHYTTHYTTLIPDLNPTSGCNRAYDYKRELLIGFWCEIGFPEPFAFIVGCSVQGAYVCHRCIKWDVKQRQGSTKFPENSDPVNWGQCEPMCSANMNPQHI